MKRLIFFSFIILSNVPILYSQNTEDEEPMLSLPDTFKFYTPTGIKYVNSLDSIKGKIFDSIENPKAYFIDTYIAGVGGYSWRIAIKKKNNYLVFDPFESGVYTETSGLVFDRIDFNGKGNKELIIKWQFYAGHSGYENSVHGRTGGVLIWDLDKLVLLMNFENYYSLQRWWTEYETDSTGVMDYSEREIISSGSEYKCEHYGVTIEKKLVLIQQDNNCPDQGDMNTHEKKDKNIYSYRLSSEGLIRRKGE